GAELHALLRKVAEFVRQHGLELAEIEHVDKAEPDQQVLARRENQIEEGGMIEDGGVDVRREINAPGKGRPGLGADPADEREQLRLLDFLDLDEQRLVLARALEQAFEEVKEEQAGADDADDAQKG